VEKPKRPPPEIRKPTAGAIIRLRSLETNEELECTSDSAGKFQITAKPGKYRLQITFKYDGCS
jgi:hypothetical protein